MYMARRGLSQRLCALLSVFVCVLALTGCSPEENLVSLTGTVIDPDGRPVPGVAALIGSGAATTDSQGRFQMEGVFVDSEAVYVLAVGRAPTRIPLALGHDAQTITLIYRPTEWIEKTPAVDFLLVFDAETHLESGDLSYSYARTMRREIQRATGLSNLEAAIPYLGAEALVCLGRSLGVRNIVWVSKHLDRHLQVFNVQDRTTAVFA